MYPFALMMKMRFSGLLKPSEDEAVAVVMVRTGQHWQSGDSEPSKGGWRSKPTVDVSACVVQGWMLRNGRGSWGDYHWVNAGIGLSQSKWSYFFSDSRMTLLGVVVDRLIQPEGEKEKKHF